MKQTLFVLLVFLSLNAHAQWDSSVLIGEWESYQHGFQHKYQKLIINKDFSGTFTYFYGSPEPQVTSFNRDNIQFFEGFAVLDIDKNFKILLSAWGTRESGNTKRLLGQLFIYMSDGDEIKLINSEPISYFSSNDESIQHFFRDISDASKSNH